MTAIPRRALRDLNVALRTEVGLSVRRIVMAPAAPQVRGGVTLVPLVRRGVLVGTAEVEPVPERSTSSDPGPTTLALIAASCVSVLDAELQRRRAADAERRLAGATEREALARAATAAASDRLRLIGRTVGQHLSSTGHASWRRRLEQLLALSFAADEEARESLQAIALLEARRDALVPSLHALATRFESTTGLSCDVSHQGGDVRLSAASSDALFRLAHEALVNISRHARATAVGMNVEVAPESVTLRIRDDGVGIAHRDPFAIPDRFGLRTMRERIQRVGGVLAAGSIRPRGVVIEAWVPVR